MLLIPASQWFDEVRCGRTTSVKRMQGVQRSFTWVRGGSTISNLLGPQRMTWKRLQCSSEADVLIMIQCIGRWSITCHFPSREVSLSRLV